MGNNEVIHYNRNEDARYCICKVSIEEFAAGKKVFKYSTDQSPLRFSEDEAVCRIKKDYMKENVIYYIITVKTLYDGVDKIMI